MVVYKSLIVNGDSREKESNKNPSLSASKVKPLQIKGFSPQMKKTESKSGKFSKPVIHPKNYKERLEEEWFILLGYRVEGRMKFIKKRVDINRFSGAEKIARAEFVRNQLHEALKNGWNPFKKEQDPFEQLKKSTLHLALLHVFNEELPGWGGDTVSSYLSSVNKFLLFIHKNKLNVPCSEFTKRHAKMYSDYLLKDVGLRTHNNRLGEIRTFFGYLVDREIIDFNPFSGVKKKKAPAGGQLPFSPDQLSKLRESLDRPALLFLDFAVDSCLRSSELQEMKVEDLLFDSCEVQVVSNLKAEKRTKDKQTRYVKIKPEIMKRMKGLVEGSEPSDYVFGTGFKPTSKKKTRDALSKVFTELLRERGFNSAYSLYSARHTGAVIKWKVEKLGAEEIMNCLGHSGWDTTVTYLKDRLGVYNRR